MTSSEREVPASSLATVNEGVGGEDSECPAHSAIFMKSIDLSTSDVEHVPSSGDVEQTSDDHPDSDIPSVERIRASKLPPVPNRLVPSKSTERILDIINQHDQEMNILGPEEQRETLLSSTPAAKSSMRHSDAVNSQVHSAGVY
jgi:hypothetical protein